MPQPEPCASPLTDSLQRPSPLSSPLSSPYAVLWVPRFRLQAALQAQTQPVPHPACPSSCPSSSPTGAPVLGLVDSASPRGVLLELSAHAEASGIRPGMAAAQALARNPALQLLAASREAETRLAARLLNFLHTLSPYVEKPQAPSHTTPSSPNLPLPLASGGIWKLSLRGIHTSDWSAWGQNALQRLQQEEGIHAVMGIAPQLGLALCAARRATPLRVVDAPEAFLEELPFEELGASPLLCQQLHDWGLSSLGDLLRLPRQATLERLGPEAAALWEMGRDTRESVLHLERFEEPLAVALDFEHPIETVAPLVFFLNRMVEQLCSRLRLLQRVAAGMTLQLHLASGSLHQRHFTVPSPCQSESVLLRILQTHLETLQFDAALVGASLKLEASIPSAQQLALFENPLRDPNRFGETLARIQALVGESSVGVPLVADSHRAESFTLGNPLTLWNAPLPATSPPPLLTANVATSLHGMLLGLPLRRFRPPLPATVRLHHHRPTHLSTSSLQGPILECRGPFRLCGHWWDHQAWQTEQWDILLGGNAQGLYRLCRHGAASGLCSAPTPEPRNPSCFWIVEGCYDTARWPSAPTPPPPQASSGFPRSSGSSASS